MSLKEIILLFKYVFDPKLLTNPLASCSLINLSNMLSHTGHFDKPLRFAYFLFLLVYHQILLTHEKKFIVIDILIFLWNVTFYGI